MKNSGRARYACALGAEVGGRCTFEKGLLIVDALLQILDEQLFGCLFLMSYFCSVV